MVVRQSKFRLIMATCILLLSSVSAKACELNLEGREIAKFPAAELPEASAMIFSTQSSNQIFFLDDGKGSDRLYSGNLADGSLKSFSLGDVRGKNFEALARISFAGRSFLVLGDIGDNKAKRKSVALHFFVEPSDCAKESLQHHHSLKIVYPDAPHNAEALIAHGDFLYIFTKEKSKTTGVYRLSWKQALNEKLSEVKLESMGEMNLDARNGSIESITDATITADGFVWLLSNSGLARFSTKHLEQISSSSFEVQIFGLSLMRRQEALAVNSQGSLFLSGESEGESLFPVYELNCRN